MNETNVTRTATDEQRRLERGSYYVFFRPEGDVELDGTYTKAELLEIINAITE